MELAFHSAAIVIIGDYTQNPSLGVNECNGDVTPVPLTSGHWRAFPGL